jgi:hypothetical protein
MNRVMIMADGPKAEAAAKATDPLASLNPRERELVEDTLKAYPQLTPEQAIEMLTEFGGL